MKYLDIINVVNVKNEVIHPYSFLFSDSNVGIAALTASAAAPSSIASLFSFFLS